MEDDRKEDQEPLTNEVSMSGYKQRQCGCLWILYLIGGMFQIIPKPQIQIFPVHR